MFLVVSNISFYVANIRKKWQCAKLHCHLLYFIIILHIIILLYERAYINIYRQHGLLLQYFVCHHLAVGKGGAAYANAILRRIDTNSVGGEVLNTLHVAAEGGLVYAGVDA